MTNMYENIVKRLDNGVVLQITVGELKELLGVKKDSDNLNLKV